MYLPHMFREERPEILRAFIAAHPLGALVATTAEEGLTANHIPMLWAARDGAANGVLDGHVARANSIWHQLAPDTAVLVIFGGANRYISPSWYPGKAEHGKVVPTWNYAVVHAHGTIRFHEDAEDSAPTLAHLNTLTDRHEAERAKPWKVSDAPADFIEPMLRRIVPFEIVITSIVGKFKSNQNRAERDRTGVDAGLQADGVRSEDRAELVRAPRA